MRKHPLLTNHYYHIYNRGVDKRDIFMNKKDIKRFILSIKQFNTLKPVGSIRAGVRHLRESNKEDDTPLVSIVCYCLNPNHFHFIVKQEVDMGISEFFKRLLGGYTNYFNKIHNRSGVLFQGKFKSHMIDSDEYFLKIRPYVNSNYLIHDIPSAKAHLIAASDKEYDTLNFNLVSQTEAQNLLSFYGNNLKFKQECLSIIEAIRTQRGKTSLLAEDPLP